MNSHTLTQNRTMANMHMRNYLFPTCKYHTRQSCNLRDYFLSWSDWLLPVRLGYISVCSKLYRHHGVLVLIVLLLQCAEFGTCTKSCSTLF